MNAHLAGVARASWEWGHYRTPGAVYVYCPLCRLKVTAEVSPAKTWSPTKTLDTAMRAHLTHDCEKV